MIQKDRIGQDQGGKGGRESPLTISSWLLSAQGSVSRSVHVGRSLLSRRLVIGDCCVVFVDLEGSGYVEDKCDLVGSVL